MPVTRPATIRRLDPGADRALVDSFWPEIADYIEIERGARPGPALSAELTEEFFTGAPPGADPADGPRLGLFDDGRLLGIVELAFGFPAPEDAYLGILFLAEAARGRGLGREFLREVERLARARGAPRLYLAVLDANPRGRAFWEREGFRPHEEGRSVTLSGRTQTACRMVKPL